MPSWATLAAAAVALAATSCSSGTSPAKHAAPTATTRPSSTTARAAGLPPSDPAGLRRVVEPILAKFDDEVQRVELEPVGGSHPYVMLSLYAKPRASRSADEYAAGIAPLARAVVPVMLARYPGIGAIDLCQEAQHPPANVAEPPPLTRVFVARPHAATVAWAQLDLAVIRRQARGDDPAIQIYVDPIVAGSAVFRAARPAS